jgi:hypothetical protein
MVDGRKGSMSLMEILIKLRNRLSRCEIENSGTLARKNKHSVIIIFQSTLGGELLCRPLLSDLSL